MYQNDTSVEAKVVSGLIHCHDSQDFRGKVLLSTQGGRKTSAARILKKNGRLWNLPIPDGFELAMFSPDDPAIFCVPGETTNLADCTRLKLYRRCLISDKPGVTFDLTHTKDCVCALPYRTYGDSAWHFLVALRGQGNLHWYLTKETFHLVNDDSKPARRRRKPPAATATSAAPKSKAAAAASTTTAQQQQQQQQQQQKQVKEEEQDVQDPQSPEVMFQVGSFVYHRESPTGPIGTIMEVNFSDALAVVAWSTGSEIIYHIADLVPALPATQPPPPTPQMVTQPHTQQQQPHTQQQQQQMASQHFQQPQQQQPFQPLQQPQQPQPFPVAQQHHHQQASFGRLTPDAMMQLDSHATTSTWQQQQQQQQLEFQQHQQQSFVHQQQPFLHPAHSQQQQQQQQQTQQHHQQQHQQQQQPSDNFDAFLNDALFSTDDPFGNESGFIPAYHDRSAMDASALFGSLTADFDMSTEFD